MLFKCFSNSLEKTISLVESDYDLIGNTVYDLSVN